MHLLSRLCLFVAVLSLLAASSRAAPYSKVPVHLDVPGDVLPMTAAKDRAQALLEWRGSEWRVVSIQATAVPSAPTPMAALAEAHAAVEFVLSDIDSDTDFDVIVVDALSNLEKSVWRNDGKGNFERLRTKRYGEERFPDGHLHRQAPSRPPVGLLLAEWRRSESLLPEIFGNGEPATAIADTPQPPHPAVRSVVLARFGRSPPRR